MSCPRPVDIRDRCGSYQSSRTEDPALMRSFGELSRRAMSAIVAIVLIAAMPLGDARAEATTASPTAIASQTPGNQPVTTANSADPNKSLTSKAIDKVKQVAKSAGD